ncbi:hypothetical protein DFH08DRAFT_825405 [Mycena albidolilacea]|uniref:Uncharacterized protein n=1 Tax=Mycena albidolilacea TaxID=1033008 RepID=A0AAD7E9A1_9AGAR|nr:hypothetical protein DFH08DRAFT_825405 [Mycena albidolilacea]
MVPTAFSVSTCDCADVLKAGPLQQRISGRESTPRGTTHDLFRDTQPHIAGRGGVLAQEPGTAERFKRVADLPAGCAELAALDLRESPARRTGEACSEPTPGLRIQGQHIDAIPIQVPSKIVILGRVVQYISCARQHHQYEAQIEVVPIDVIGKEVRVAVFLVIHADEDQELGAYPEDMGYDSRRHQARGRPDGWIELGLESHGELASNLNIFL